MREKISELLNTLGTAHFMQVHKSFAIAKKHIEVIEGNRILIGKTNIPIGAMYKLNVAQFLKSR